MEMDQHQRLKLTIIAVLCTLNVVDISTQNNTNISATLPVVEEHVEGHHLTDGGQDDNNMTTTTIRNKQAFGNVTTMRFDDFSTDPTIEDGYYRNVSTNVTTRNNKSVVNSESTLHPSYQMLNTTRSVLNFVKRFTGIDTFITKSVTTDLNTPMDTITDSEIQFAQPLTSTDAFQIASTTSDSTNKIITDRGLLSNTSNRNIKAQTAVASGTRDINGIQVTGTPGSINLETNHETSKSISNYALTQTMSSTAVLQVFSESSDYNTGHATSLIEASSSNPKADYCHQYGGCDLVPGPVWYCQCDDLCVEFNDCCRDYTLNNKDTKSKYSCVGIRDEKSNTLGIQAISVCPDVFTNTTIMSMCTDGPFMSVGPPVLDIMDKSRFYRNKYCALCHGVDALSLDIALTVNPSSFEDIDNVLNFTDVQFQQYVLSVAKYRLLIPEDAKVRYCITNIFENDNYLCNLYSNPIFSVKELKFYRNAYCLETSINILTTRCLYGFMAMFESTLNGSPILKSKLTILFSFSRKDDSATEDNCQIWSEANDKDCAHLPKYINAQISLNYNIRLPTNVTNFEIMQSVLLTLIAKEVDGFITVSLPYQLFVDEDLTLVNVQLDCRILKTVFGHELSAIKKRINEQTVKITETNNKDRHFIITDKRYHEIIVNKTIKFFGKWELVLENRSKFFSHFGVPDVLSTELCDEVKLDVKRLPTDSLSIITMDCLSDLSLQRHTSYLPILTCVFSGVSCTSLIVLIVYNRLHHLHYEIPFANLENLSLASIFSTILLSVGQIAPYINKWVCYSISVVSHYSWLLVFSFKSLAVLYIVQTLMQMKGRRLETKENKIKKRRRITGIGIVIPLLFVAPAIVVDLHGPAYFSPGYLNGAFCFPIQFPGNFIFFTGPVLATIIINTVCIIQIITRVHLAHVAARNVRQSSLLTEAKIFLRILSISGCFWLTGIMAAYFKLEWLEYVFTVFCGLQGLFVAIANLTTRRMSSLSGGTQSTNET